MKKKQVKKHVEAVLRAHEDAREDDNYCIVRVWYKMFPGYFAEHDGQSYLSTMALLSGDLPSAESIRRSRQKLQEEGLYLPQNTDVLKRRGRLKENVTKNINNDNWGEVIDKIS